MIRLLTSQLEEILAHARQAEPSECCGLIGGTDDERTKSIYSLRNIASNPEVAYEAAPEELFVAQRLMREREERLLASLKRLLKRFEAVRVSCASQRTPYVSPR